MSPLRRAPTVLLSYFRLRDLRALLDAVARTGLSQRATVYVGSYGASLRAAALVQEEGCVYGGPIRRSLAARYIAGITLGTDSSRASAATSTGVRGRS
jgi:hypothetical protein